MRNPRLRLAIVCLLAAGLALALSADGSSANAPAAGHSQTRLAGLDSRTLSGRRLSRLEGLLSGLEQGLLDDAADGRFDRHSLLAAALVAGGMDDPGQIENFERRLDAWIEQLQGLPRVDQPEAQAAAVFRFLHAQVLTGGYQREGTDLADTLQNGRFNCLSSTVLFHCLASRLGLHVCALALPGHAMARITCGGRTIDVETTCPGWFELLDDPDSQAELLNRATGKTASQLRPRELTPVQLTGMIYYNRGLDLLAQRRFEAALAANARALRLDPASGPARGNLLATLNNWAIALAQSAQYAEALRWLEQGFDLDPHYPAFTVNYVYVRREWANALHAAGRPTEAQTVIDEARRRMPDEPCFARPLP